MQSVKILLILVSVALLLGVAYVIHSNRNQIEDAPKKSLSYERTQVASEDWLDLQVFKDMFGAGYQNSLVQIENQWRPGYATMLFEATRMMKDRSRGEQAVALLEKMARLKTAHGEFNVWLDYIFDQKAETPPYYSDFKAFVYAKKDESFAEYFEGNPDTEIRLDEVVWGGVIRDGIPPLKNPKMIKADEAIYLDDSNVTFGISINGDSRAYPKRILAWHEMFKDTIGGQSVCGVY